MTELAVAYPPMTPISMVWDESLLRPSNAPTHGETLLSDDVASKLVIGADGFGEFAEWLPQPTRSIVEQRPVPGKEGWGVGHADVRSIRYEVTPSGVAALVRVVANRTGLLYEAIDSLKMSLDLEWPTVTHLLGVNKRTFFDNRKKRNMPAAKAAEVEARVAELQSLAERNSESTRRLIASRLDEVARAFEAGDFEDVEELFQESQRQSARMSGEYVRQLRDQSADLSERMVGVQRWLTQTAETNADAAAAASDYVGSGVARAEARLEVEAAVAAAHGGDPLDEDWLFVATLTHDAMDDFLRRATTVIGSEEFDVSSWHEFVQREEKLAWAAHRPRRAAPHEPEPLEPVRVAPPSEPDFSRFAIVPLEERLKRFRDVSGSR